MPHFNLAGTGVQTTTGRHYNRRVLLSLIALNPHVAMVDLARLANLSPQTVGSLVEDLRRDGLVQVGSAKPGKKGPPARPLTTIPNGAFAVGVDVGRHHIVGVLMNLAGETIERHRRDYTSFNADVVDGEIRGMLKPFLARLTSGERARICGIGVTVAEGLVKPDDLVRLAAKVQDSVEVPTELISRGGAATWAAYRECSRPRPRTFAAIFLDWSVTGGLVLDGNLFDPESTSARQDVGSILFNGSETLNSVASIAVLKGRMAEVGIDVPVSGPEFWGWPPEGQTVTSTWTTQVAYACSRAFLAMVCLTGVETVGLGGSLPAHVLTGIATEVQKQLHGLANEKRITVSSASSGGSAAALGAAYLVLFRKFFSREARYVVREAR